MKELLKNEDVVRRILTVDERARYDDMYLYLMVTTAVLGYDTGRVPFERIMCHYNDMGLPHFESVRRARQKLQAACEDLQPTEKRQHKRLARQTDYVQYAGSYTE